jgi:acylphosphatase
MSSSFVCLEVERAHLLIRGRVQGVWYRASTQRKAASLGLAGWVRNLGDGRVEAVAQGPREALDALVSWAHDGPPAARVDNVSVRWSEPGELLEGFELRRTANLDE